MAKKGTDFSKYAQAFYETIDCGHSQIDMFTKHLLSMGLTRNDKAYIDDIFPEIIDKKGNVILKVIKVTCSENISVGRMVLAD